MSIVRKLFAEDKIDRLQFSPIIAYYNVTILEKRYRENIREKNNCVINNISSRGVVE